MSATVATLKEAAAAYKVAATNFQDCLDNARRLENDLDKARQQSIEADHVFKKAEATLLEVASEREGIR